MTKPLDPDHLAELIEQRVAELRAEFARQLQEAQTANDEVVNEIVRGVKRVIEKTDDSLNHIDRRLSDLAKEFKQLTAVGERLERAKVVDLPAMPLLPRRVN
jgi:hypothetical protein